MRVKLPNIVGIQSKPFTPQFFEEEQNANEEYPFSFPLLSFSIHLTLSIDDEEGKKKKHTIAESVIRWRYTPEGSVQ